MKKYYLTFGQKYRRENHPNIEVAHPDGYGLILAQDETEARIKAAQICGVSSEGFAFYAFIYEEANFEFDLYPLGQLFEF